MSKLNFILPTAKVFHRGTAGIHTQGYTKNIYSQINMPQPSGSIFGAF